VLLKPPESGGFTQIGLGLEFASPPEVTPTVHLGTPKDVPEFWHGREKIPMAQLNFHLRNNSVIR